MITFFFFFLIARHLPFLSSSTDHLFVYYNPLMILTVSYHSESEDFTSTMTIKQSKKKLLATFTKKREKGLESPKLASMGLSEIQTRLRNSK